LPKIISVASSLHFAPVVLFRAEVSPMHTPRVPLSELTAAVENAVQQTLAKHGAVPIEKLWVGFVAPEALANEKAAEQVATLLAREAGVPPQGSVAQIGVAAPGAANALAQPHRIIGLIFDPKALKHTDK
jgi:hypothetical protein